MFKFSVQEARRLPVRMIGFWRLEPISFIVSWDLLRATGVIGQDFRSRVSQMDGMSSECREAKGFMAVRIVRFHAEIAYQQLF